MILVCGNCLHKRIFHKKVDGNAMCSVAFCACKEFIERKIPLNRRKLHDDFDQFLDASINFEAKLPPEED